jgi:hypothetical protein
VQQIIEIIEYKRDRPQEHLSRRGESARAQVAAVAILV